MKDYYNYAITFWKTINSVFNSKNPLPSYIPIVFANPQDDIRSKNNLGFTVTYINERTGKASIFPLVFLFKSRSENEIKQTIRHEIIHYYLGLHYHNHQDDCALFWLVCSLFDAGAYEKMSAQSQSIFDLSEPYITKAYNLHIAYPENNTIPINLSLMLTAIDDLEKRNSTDTNKLKTLLKICLERCQTTCKDN